MYQAKRLSRVLLPLASLVVLTQVQAADDISLADSTMDAITAGATVTGQVTAGTTLGGAASTTVTGVNVPVVTLQAGAAADDEGATSYASVNPPPAPPVNPNPNPAPGTSSSSPYLVTPGTTVIAWPF